MNVKRVLVTGANGFLGTNVVKELLSDPETVVRAMVQPGTPVNVMEQFRQEVGTDRLEIVSADLFAPTLEEAVEGSDQIVHLAALVTDWAPKQLFWKVIVDGTKVVLDAAAKFKVGRFVYMSSLTVHEFGNHVNDDETTPRDMKSFPYGVAKIGAEDEVTAWASAGDGRDFSIIRPGFSIFGPYDRGSFINVVDALLKNGFGFIANGKAIQNFVYVGNLAAAIRVMLDAPSVSGVYNVSDGNLSWHDFVKAWCDAAGCKMPKLNTSFGGAMFFASLLEGSAKLFRSKKPPILTRYRIRVAGTNLGYSAEKFRREFGFVPPFSLEEGIRRTLEYYHAQHPEK
jgi:nucleoside-diphosphate-sugar epimerase